MAESKKETVRIPMDLAAMISREFVDTGLFSSKADFVSTAIRFYYEDSISLFGDPDNLSPKSQEISEYIGKKTNRRIVQSVLINPEYLDWMDQFNGDKVSVLLRLPRAFVERYERFIYDTGLYRSKADFFNNAIGAYLVFQTNFEEMSENFYRVASRNRTLPRVEDIDGWMGGEGSMICADIAPRKGKRSLKDE